MSKSLNGISSATINIDQLNFTGIEATNVTANSQLTTTNATISGNLALGALTNVEQAIADAASDWFADILGQQHVHVHVGNAYNSAFTS